ncbi:DUF3592 domain-containing protein [Maribacter sp. MMG018]|uniref:DUF3592 domain-containing protein n=1 Tax=Maribacter sp. MMG018 TaxID=2822688 RepID=UPI001B371BBC|nr:DUF3592 domain-containing protein [Maribacter sp. MMG018]MBQ4915335.1 DUF3592 domain-containing protein [Maribacter sp. MMG018]
MIITFFIGFTVFFFGVSSYILDMGSKKWHRTIGTITHSEIKERTMKDSDGRKEVSYRPDLEYVYHLNGQENKIIGKKLFPYFEFWSPNKKEIKAISDKLKKGTQVNVFYHPKKPTKSCLIVGHNYYVHYAISAGMFFMAIALVIWIYELSEDLTLVLDQITAR